MDDLARPKSHSIALGLVTLALGAAVGIVGWPRSPAPQEAVADSAGTVQTLAVASPVELARARAWRDEAESLTPAEVALDERAIERWLPLLPRLESRLADPEVPEIVAKELEATLLALERAGVASRAK